jgi:hypothetical protein
MRRGRPTLASKDATPGAKATTPPVVDLTKPGKNAQSYNGPMRIRELSLRNPPNNMPSNRNRGNVMKSKSGKNPRDFIIPQIIFILCKCVQGKSFLLLFVCVKKVLLIYFEKRL